MISINVIFRITLIDIMNNEETSVARNLFS